MSKGDKYIANYVQCSTAYDCSVGFMHGYGFHAACPLGITKQHRQSKILQECIKGKLDENNFTLSLGRNQNFCIESFRFFPVISGAK